MKATVSIEHSVGTLGNRYWADISWPKGWRHERQAHLRCPVRATLREAQCDAAMVVAALARETSGLIATALVGKREKPKGAKP